MIGLQLLGGGDVRLPFAVARYPLPDFRRTTRNLTFVNGMRAAGSGQRQTEDGHRTGLRFLRFRPRLDLPIPKEEIEQLPRLEIRDGG